MPVGLAGTLSVGLRLLKRCIGSRSVALVVLVLGMGLTLAIAGYVSHSEMAQAAKTFHVQNRGVSDSFARRFAGFRLLLKSSAGIVEASHGQINEAFWDNYVGTLNLLGTYPGIQAVGYARWDNADGGLRVVVLAPQEDAVGGDLLRQQGLREAIVSNIGHNGGEFILADWALGVGTHSEYILLYPVSLELSHEKVGEHPGGGYVFALLSTRDLMRGVIGDVGDDLSLTLVDKGERPGQADRSIFSVAQTRASEPVFREQLGLLPGGKVWQLELESTESFEQGIKQKTSSVVLISGGAISILLAAFSWYLLNLRRIAEQRATEINRELGHSEKRFSLAMRASQDGIWDHDLRTGETYLSPRIGEMLGYAGDTPMPPLESLMHSQDRPAWQAIYSGGVGDSENFSLELRMHHRRGRWLWVRTAAITVKDAAGRVEWVVGALTDITEARRANEELIEHRDKLQHLVDLRTRELRLAKEAAEHASEAKTQFLSNMSHELRTPMHAVLSFARLGFQRADGADTVKIRRYFHLISDSGERLLALINDLLDLSKLETGKMSMEFVNSDIVTIVRAVLSEMEPLAEARAVRFDLQVSAHHTQLPCDTGRIAQVVRNLLSNALKFSPQPGWVRVRIEDGTLGPDRPASAGNLAASCVRLRVSDQGCGVPENEYEAIFEKYVQSSKTRSGAGGTGLGLAICREIIAAHHGLIFVRNQPEGGACFEVQLPLTHKT